MENNYYETPQLEVLEIAVEQGFATSTVDYKEGWDLSICATKNSRQ